VVYDLTPRYNISFFFPTLKANNKEPKKKNTTLFLQRSKDFKMPKCNYEEETLKA
jgi:hypothetical protein